MGSRRISALGLRPDSGGGAGIHLRGDLVLQPAGRDAVQPQHDVPCAGLEITGEVPGSGGVTGDDELIAGAAGPTPEGLWRFAAQVEHTGGAVVAQRHVQAVRVRRDVDGEIAVHRQRSVVRRPCSPVPRRGHALTGSVRSAAAGCCWGFATRIPSARRYTRARAFCGVSHAGSPTRGSSPSGTTACTMRSSISTDTRAAAPRFSTTATLPGRLSGRWSTERSVYSGREPSSTSSSSWRSPAAIAGTGSRTSPSIRCRPAAVPATRAGSRFIGVEPMKLATNTSVSYTHLTLPTNR